MLPVHIVHDPRPLDPAAVLEPDRRPPADGGGPVFSTSSVLFRALFIGAFLCATTCLTLLAVSQTLLNDLHNDHVSLFHQNRQTTLFLNEMWKDVQQLPANSGIIPVGQLLSDQHAMMHEELIVIHHNVTTLSLQLHMLVDLLQQWLEP